MIPGIYNRPNTTAPEYMALAGRFGWKWLDCWGPMEYFLQDRYKDMIENWAYIPLAKILVTSAVEYKVRNWSYIPVEELKDYKIVAWDGGSKYWQPTQPFMAANWQTFRSYNIFG